MGKNLEELGSYQDFRAPWETESGDEAEVDKGKLKKLLFNARSGRAAALDERDEAQEKLSSLELDLEAVKSDLAKSNGEEVTKKLNSLQKKVEDLTAERDRMVAEKEEADLRADVLQGLDAKYAKYVVGKTREELEKSLEEVRSDFGLDSSDPDDDPESDDEPVARTTPRVRLSSGIDRDSSSGEDVDFEKAVDSILSDGVF